MHDVRDPQLRIESLGRLRQLTRLIGVDLTYFGYHDITELPDTIPMLEDVA